VEYLEELQKLKGKGKGKEKVGYLENIESDSRFKALFKD